MEIPPNFGYASYSSIEFTVDAAMESVATSVRGIYKPSSVPPSLTVLSTIVFLKRQKTTMGALMVRSVFSKNLQAMANVSAALPRRHVKNVS
jgi:hypothetical protein